MQSPISVSGAAPPPVPQAVKSGAGLLLGAVIGATAAYFVPKVLDRVIEGSQSENVELDVDGYDE